LSDESRNRNLLAEELLAVRCQLGEPAAFEELVALLHLRLWGYLVRLVGDRNMAEDALQETWLRVLRGVSRLRERDRLFSWVFGIGRRVAMDQLRRRRVVVDLDDAAVQQLAAAEEPGELEDESLLLHEGLLELPLLEREVLTLFYLEELSLRQVSEVVGVPEGTVKSRLFRARRMLHERFLRNDTASKGQGR
jgi:RNA polymerase sigma factor (sigma-70 family)